MDTIPLSGTTPHVARILGNGEACPGVSTSGNYKKTGCSIAKAAAP